eukprot:scaffold9580_cov36-Attheya_sp.AAC.2
MLTERGQTFFAQSVAQEDPQRDLLGVFRGENLAEMSPSRTNCGDDLYTQGCISCGAHTRIYHRCLMQACQDPATGSNNKDGVVDGLVSSSSTSTSTGKRKRQPEYRNGDKWAMAKTNVPPSYVSAIQRAEEWVSKNIELKPSFFDLVKDQVGKQGGGKLGAVLIPSVLYKSSGLEQAFSKKKEQRPALEGLDPKSLVLSIVDAANEAIL